MSKKTTHEKDRPRVLGRKVFEAITAVEGLRLSEASRSRVSKLLASGLSPDERRAAVVRAYRGQKGGR